MSSNPTGRTADGAGYTFPPPLHMRFVGTLKAAVAAVTVQVMIRRRTRCIIAGLAGLWCLAAHGGPPDGPPPEPAAYPGPIRTSDAGTATPREIPFFPSAANARGWQGFVRVVNHSDEDGAVSIRAFDDAGRDFGTLTLAIDAGETVHFNSDDLEDGNASKGLTGSTGRPAQGDWRLRLTSTLSIEAMAYVRTADGLLTAMHDVAPMVEGAGQSYRVVTFNPGSNDSQASLLRLVNPGAAEAAVTITGVDDRGRHRGPVRLSIPPRAARTISAADLEGGAANLDGTLGDGGGKWRLAVESDAPVRVMSLLASPTGHLTNLSTVPLTARTDAGGWVFLVPFFPAAGNAHGWQGFVRIANYSDAPAEVTILAADDAGRGADPLLLELDGGETAHFNSGDLEDGNASKGLASGIGRPGAGDWRLSLVSSQRIDVLAYVRTSDGLLTAMHDFAPAARDGSSTRVVTFNPGSNHNQESLLRLVNPGAAEAAVTITGVDDRGAAGGSVQLRVAARASRTVSAADLEEGAANMDGALGDGSGKWRLTVAAEGLIAMSLLASPTGHLTNLSTVPSGTATPARPADRAYAVGETLASLPTGVWHPDYLQPGGGVRTSTTISSSSPDEDWTEIALDDAAFFDLNDVRYTCRSAGGCIVRDREVIEGSILQTTLGGGRDDHGDSRASATPVAVGSDTPGVLDTADVDWFRVEVDGPGLLEVRTSGFVDTEGRLEQAGGTLVTENDDGPDQDNFRITARISAGTHYVGVRGWEPDETGSYTLHVRFSAADPGAPASAVVTAVDTFRLLNDNLDPIGITFANGRFHVIDQEDGKVYAYTASGAPDHAAGFDLDSENDGAWGLVYANGRYYVVDLWDDKVYAYTASGERVVGADFELTSDNRSPRDIAYVDGRFHVVDSGEDKVFAYTAAGDRDPEADFDLQILHFDADSIVHANGRFYIGDEDDAKVYAYTVAGDPDPEADFELQDNFELVGIAYADSRFHIAYRYKSKVHAYTAAGERDVDADFDLQDRGNLQPRVIAYANGRFHVADGEHRKLYAYTTSGRYDPDADFDLQDRNGYARGITFANGRFHVLDQDDDRVYAYTASGRPDPDANFDLRLFDDGSSGIAFAGGRFHVVNEYTEKVYAYTASGERDPDADFFLQHHDGYPYRPQAMVHVDGRLHILDANSHTNDKNMVYAYTLSGQRDPAADFETPANIDVPRGMAYANGRFHLTAQEDDKVYSLTVDLPDSNR